VSACPWCEKTFDEAVKVCGSNLKVFDVVELLRKHLEGEKKMDLSKEVYQEFVAVVGAENICDDPAIMPLTKHRFCRSVLPKDTAVVQAVVKLCNKQTEIRHLLYRLVRAVSRRYLLLEMRRMNHIIEIMRRTLCVVEPYVISAS
jgi:hypothetical protein